MSATIAQEAAQSYSRHKLRPMRPYQLEMALARERALYAARSGEVWEQIELVARQGGKNEMDAQFSVRNLARMGVKRQQAGLSFQLAIKTAPSYKPGVALSKRRFEQTVAETQLKLAKRDGYIYQVNGWPAGLAFLSAGTEANKRGETAALWMSVDECQDTSAEVYDAELAPMRSSTNAPAFFSGTMRGEQCLANVKMQELLKQQGDKPDRWQRRVFVYDWQTIAEHNEAYGKFVERERDRLTPGNPIFLAEYCLVPIRAVGMFFTEQDIEKLFGGTHDRERVHTGEQSVLVGGVDFCGVDETEDQDAFDPDRQRRRDATCAGVGLLRWKKDQDGLHPIVQVVDLLWLPGLSPMAAVDKLEQFLFSKYRCARVVVDGRGVGDAPAAMLQQRRGGPDGQVEVLKSTVADVTRMGWNLLSMVQSERLKMFKSDGSAEWDEMRIQCQELRRTVRANQTLKWEAATRMPVVDGTRRPVHDDGPKMLGYLTEAAHLHLTANQPVRPVRDFVPWAEAQATVYGQEAA